MADKSTKVEGDRNPDPITGAPGSHPVGTGIGAAGGGLAGAAAGAAIGSVVPGIGTVVGGVVGTIVGATGGGLAGKGIAENIDPTTEDAYWRENYKTRPYVQSGKTYTDYRPAYEYGWESRKQYPEQSFDEVEPTLRDRWSSDKTKAGFEWDKAKGAVKDAWDRIGGSTATREMHEGETAVPVMEEQLNVGKRQVEGGGVRVRTKVEEKPVEAQVKLQEETVRVDRRPVDRPATEADFARAQGGTIEATETKEVPVVNKQAKVVEEVIVGKEARERTETVRDTVRKTDVDVEKVNPTDDAKSRQKNPSR
jgi:uncharacterized protein (TIGR02271 family)